MEYIVIALLSLLAIFLLYLLSIRKENIRFNPPKIKKDRFCPLCGTKLNNENDCVIGDYSKIDGRTKVYIYGCNYCLRGKKRGKRLYL